MDLSNYRLAVLLAFLVVGVSFLTWLWLSEKSVHADIAGREEGVEFVHQLIVDRELLHEIVEFLHGNVEGGNRTVSLAVIDDECEFAFVFV